MQRNIAAGAGEQGNYAFAVPQGSKLLGAANLRGVGAGRQQGQGNWARIQCLLDFLRPGRAAGDAPGVEPGVEPFRGKVRLQSVRELRPVLRGVRMNTSLFCRLMRVEQSSILAELTGPGASLAAESQIIISRIYPNVGLGTKNPH